MFDAQRTIADRIRDAISALAGLPTEGLNLEDETDLYGAGMKSFASVQLMVALEDMFEIEFPETMLTRATFRSPAAIERAVRTLKAYCA
jgi:acyl carrier protein